MRFRFEKVIRAAQDSICAAIEEVDGTKFRQVRGAAAGFDEVEQPTAPVTNNRR
jgi:hypothetical protein